MTSLLPKANFADDKYVMDQHSMSHCSEKVYSSRALSRRHGNVNRRGSSLMDLDGFKGKEKIKVDRDSDAYKWGSFRPLPSLPANMSSKTPSSF
jgi:hypothetical protein